MRRILNGCGCPAATRWNLGIQWIRATIQDNLSAAGDGGFPVPYPFGSVLHPNEQRRQGTVCMLPTKSGTPDQHSGRGTRQAKGRFAGNRYSRELGILPGKPPVEFGRSIGTT